jgi:hypothetical protein
VASERLELKVSSGLMTAALGSARVRPVAFWLRKAGISVADQGVFSGANFLTNVLLARWLGPRSSDAVGHPARLLRRVDPRARRDRGRCGDQGVSR